MVRPGAYNRQMQQVHKDYKYKRRKHQVRRVEHAEYMLALRINRRNGDGNAYWAMLGGTSPHAANQNGPAVSQKSAA